MIRVKPGVRIAGIRAELVLALRILEEEFKQRGEYVTITSVTEGKHSLGSLHPKGLAVDIRLPRVGAVNLVRTLKAILPDDFDVVLEETHIHVEFDPKEVK